MLAAAHVIVPLRLNVNIIFKIFFTFLICISAHISLTPNGFAMGNVLELRSSQSELKAEALVQNVLTSYKSRQPYNFLVCLSDDFIPNTSTVRRVIENDFETYGNIYLNANLVHTKSRGSKIAVEVDWNKRWSRIDNGSVQTSRGTSTLFFDTDKTPNLLLMIKGDSIFGDINA